MVRQPLQKSEKFLGMFRISKPLMNHIFLNFIYNIKNHISFIGCVKTINLLISHPSSAEQNHY